MNIRITTQDVQEFAEWSADRNPLHVDLSAARATYFGQPVVHGMLSAIRALGVVESLSVRSLDIEFRGALFPDAESSVEVAREADQVTLALRSNGHVVLIARGEVTAPSSESRAPSPESRAPGQTRAVPAVRDLKDLAPRTVVEGIYPAGNDVLAAGALTAGQARVLALSSYIVGMELPGLQSVFTHATFSFFEPIPAGAPLRYRAEVVKLDQQFRMLETRLDVATLDGRSVATAALRSYVRFSPVVTPVATFMQEFGTRRALDGRVALVTGGTRGLGADLTAALAAAGCRVYASYHKDENAARRLRQQLEEHGLGARFLQGDAGDGGWCDTAIETIIHEQGHLDVLVLNACAPPVSARLGADARAAENYIASNLRLARSPLAASLPDLDRTQGTVVAISSSFVDDSPTGFGDYVALKQAVEALVRSAVRESAGVGAVIARPPRLQTSWNDTPTGVLGTIPADRVATTLVHQLVDGVAGGAVSVMTEFPERGRGGQAPSSHTERVTVPLERVPVPLDPDFSVVLASSFTAEPVARGLRFWFNELEINGDVEVAPYGQVLQTLLNPASGAPRRGLTVVLLRVRDWLRELAEDRREALDYVKGYLEDTSRDLERAIRTHRAHAAADTVLLLPPSTLPGPRYGDASTDVSASAEAAAGRSARPHPSPDHDALLEQTERSLIERLQGCPGLYIIEARDYHHAYAVAERDLADPIREKIAHIPYRDGYLYTLSTIVMREVHRRLAPLRKVVVVDCDNTLWRGVVGEVGAEGIEFDDSHRALHDRLSALSASGVLVCLCSKNEEEDVWRVFETRPDIRLRRDQIVASMINWQPKSENLRRLAARLNLGLDSFVFLDDNPVECAEVRAACPEILTLEWPADAAAATRLLAHAWELAPGRSTAEDARRTEMYREEFRRQELQDTLSFSDFLKSLDLSIDVRPLDASDLKRAAQLTLRTNQFNFTTRRRDEAEMQGLVDGRRHVIRTIRVRDRFGDYGLVGLVIAEPQTDLLAVDTFLLSCRVLGRGVEHHMTAELGRIAAAEGLRSVRMAIEFTKRNTPARKFLQAIIRREHLIERENALECEVPSEWLAGLRFEPGEGPVESFAEADGAGAAPRPVDGQSLRSREIQIKRIADQLSTAAQLRTAIDGKPDAPAGAAVDEAGASAIVYQAFSSALGLPPARVKEIDSLEALGCDSFKIVEITVALIDRFPSLPATLLFEHRSVSEIARQIVALTTPPSIESPATGLAAAVALEDDRHNGDIAIVGMHARCAGANSTEELWNLLSRAGVAIVPVPADRPAFLHDLADVRPHWAGLLDDVERFDAELFGVVPREADVMDPQLRVFLEVAMAALEDGGCLGREHDPDTGVFVGVMYSDYAPGANLAVRSKELPYRSWESFSMANRLSQLLGFRGPSMAVDTACSSSATALHFACRALRAGDCNAAVVGGVNLILDPNRFVHLGRLGILSITGRCLAFGAEADGTILGEGAGAVVLRPLADALRRGDRILGVIKGTGVSTGSGTVGFTAPNPQAQAEAIRRALVAARVDPRTIGYVETHGTGTSLGDPIEVRGLTLAYGLPELRDRGLEGDGRCGIGSIKPNIGHLEAGAGVLGLVKVLMQLQHEALLPSVTSDEPNPQIPFAQTPFYIQRQLEPWKRPVFRLNGASLEVPRRAALSSFGVGGSNAHIILEEASGAALADDTSDGGGRRAEGGSVSQPDIARPSHVLTLSARTDEALRARAGQMADWLKNHLEVPVADAFFSANVGRRQLDRRAAVVADSREQAVGLLEQVAAGKQPRGTVLGSVSRAAGRPKLAFLCTGQGSQHPRMGAVLYDTQPVFRGALDCCAAIFDRVLGKPLLRLLFAGPESEDALLLNQTGFTQPALFAYEYALAQLWASWGVTPDLIFGHSVGEIAAMCIAGGVSLEDGLELIAARGTLMQALPAGGAMASVMADETRVAQAIAGRENLALAAINGPSQIVISGDGTALSEVVRELADQGIKSTPLTVSHAFHSPLMRPMVNDYTAVVKRVRFSMPRVPLVSGVHGAVAGEEVTTPEYWIRNILDPVRFTAAMSTLTKEGAGAFLEIGPQPVLVGMGRRCVPEESSARWLASARRDADAWTAILAAAGELHVAGFDLDWKQFDAPYGRRRITIPAYPFGGKRHWITPAADALPAGRARDGSGAGDASGPQGYELVWTSQPALVRAAAASGRWVVFADNSGIGTELVRELEELGGRCTVVFKGSEFLQAGSTNYQINPERGDDVERLFNALSTEAITIRGVVSTWPVDATTVSESAIPCQARWLTNHALHLVQASVRNSAHRAPRVWFVTRAAVAIRENDPVSVVQGPVWGFGRTVALEQPEIWGGLLDIGVDPDPQVAVALAAELVAASDDDQVAIRPDGRYVPRLAAMPAVEGAVPAFHADATYLVTGGLGAIGQRVCRWLIARGARHLLVTGRRGGQTPGAQDFTTAIERLGGSVRIIAADVSRSDDVDSVMAELQESGRPGGIFHVAGIDSPAAIPSLSGNDLAAVLKPKVDGAWLLHDRSRSIPLDHFVCFSSISSVLGAAGRAHYTAANAFLDALACERRRLNLPALTVNWGPWKGGGIATPGVLEQFERIGNHGLDPDRAMLELEKAMRSRRAQVCIADIEWPKFKQAYELRRGRPIVANLGSAPGRPVAQAEPSGAPWLDILSRTPVDQREAKLARLLRQEVADTLGYDSAEAVSADRSFQDMGMDSLMSAEFAGRIQKKLGTRATALVFEQPRIAALAARLLGVTAIAAAAAEPPPHAGVSGPQVVPQEASEHEVPTPSPEAGPIVGYSREVEPLVYAFQEEAWPSRRRDWIAPRWNWMFVESARRLGLDPRVWLYRDNGRIAAHNGAIPVRVKIGGGERDTAWLVDTMVLEQYRSQALGARLMVKAHEDLPFALSLGQTQQMRDIQLRLGWEQVAPLQTAQFLIRPERVLKGKLPPGAAAAAGMGLRAANAMRGGLKGRGVEAVEIARFGPEHDALWEKMAATVTCAVRRDASYLNWKYVQQPGQNFIRLEVRDQNQARGVIVLVVREPDDAYRYRRGFIVDVVAPLDDPALLRKLIKAALRAAARAGADALNCLHISPPLTAALKAAGFRLRTPERYLLVRPADLDGETRRYALAGDSWYVTQGDSDIDRPW